MVYWWLAGVLATGVQPAVDFDLQGFLDRELAAGRRQIVIPPGRYRVKPRARQHLVLRGLQEVTVVADGVELVCTETTRALTIAECRNLVLRGLTIDYDPLPFTQGRIVALSADKKVHDIELCAGYPPAGTARNFKYEIFAADARTLRCGDHYLTKVEAVDATHLRLNCGAGSAGDPEQVGDLIVIGSEHAPGGSIPHAVECAGNVGVRLEQITLYASNCFGFLEHGCDGSVYDRCRIDRRPADSDPVRRADPRLRSLNADAFHSKHALKGPAYLGCTARFMGDDAINICGDYHYVTEARGAVLRVLAKQTLNIAVGDPVELLAYDGSRLPDAVATKIEPDGRITEAERGFLLKQRMNDNLRTKGNSLAYRVTLDRAVDLPLGSLIASARRMGNGFRVEGCDFGFNRSRGILIKASDGRVVGNKLTANWGEAIKVSPEYWWQESGSSNNVEVRDNQITGCRTIALAVYAHGAQTLAPAGAHRHITVTGNRIADSPIPNILVTSTDGLRLAGNLCTPAQDARISGHYLWLFGLDAGKLEAVMTKNCLNVTRE